MYIYRYEIIKDTNWMKSWTVLVHVAMAMGRRASFKVSWDAQLHRFPWASALFTDRAYIYSLFALPDVDRPPSRLQWLNTLISGD